MYLVTAEPLEEGDEMKDSDTACFLQSSFETQAEHHPDLIALQCADQQLSYEVVNEKAKSLSDFLKFQGIEQDQRVGLCLERSVDLIIAILAVLKAGGAYVPLDPEYPQERLIFM